MKILMLGWELPPHNSGGLGEACLNLSKALVEAGVEIDFVVPYAAKHPEIEFMKVLSATEVDPLFRFGFSAYDSWSLDDIVIDGRETEKWSIREIQKQYCRFVEQYLDGATPDVVHAHDWLTFEAGMLAKRKCGVQLVAHVHATEYDRAGMHSGNPLVHEIEQEALMMADRVLAVSEGTRRIIHEKYGIPLEKIEVVYNSLGYDFLNDQYDYEREDYRYLEDLKKQGYTIISTVGRFTVQKGLWHLMQAAALALEKEPKLMFVFAGDGEERNQLMMQAAKLGIAQNVIFTGWIRGRQRRDIYSVSDVFVMSSVSEPFGLTALEAAHHGNVLILTKQSGVAEVLWSVLEYDFWDEKKLADEMVAVARSAGLRRELREGVMKEYRKLSWKKVAQKCISVYNEVNKHKRKK